MANRIFLLLLTVLTVLSRISAKEYKAAAFEHRPYFVNSPTPPTRQEALQIMKRNTATYSEQATRAHKDGAQIIVFPEDGIYGLQHTRETIKPYLETIPQVTNVPIIPCINPRPNTEMLQELSCIARNNSIALVANMGDIQYCTKSDPNCPDDGRYQYNTDVVFDSDGRLLAKYHKQHLFFEIAFNTPTKCEFVTFVTSFQVRFGVFTCFDMMFKDPAIDLVQIYGVHNIVFPTAWFKGFPMLISIEFQQAWSRVNCVNLIAANLLIPEIPFFSGSGIYDCGAAKTYIFANDPIEERLIFATLSENGETQNNGRYDGLKHEQKLYRRGVIDMVKEIGEERQTFQDMDSESRLSVLNDPLRSGETFEVLILGNVFTVTKLTSPTSRLSVCANALCCNIEYSLPLEKEFTETFIFGAFAGENPDGFYWEVCLLVKCASNAESSCGTSVIGSETVFDSFSINGNFSHTALVFPTSLGSGVSLFSPTEIEFADKRISGKALGKPLLSAGLLGRVYSKDKTWSN